MEQVVIGTHFAKKEKRKIGKMILRSFDDIKGSPSMCRTTVGITTLATIASSDIKTPILLK